MASPPTILAGKLLQLLGFFHRGSLDVPGGLFSRACVFRLNGLAYEDTLGRPMSDPLTRLLGRGPAAYRFLAQGLRYAVPDLTVQLDELQGHERGGLVTAVATLAGTPRGGGSVRAVADVAFVTDAEGHVTEVGVQVSEDLRRALAAARSA
jgi:hypothetical protein